MQEVIWALAFFLPIIAQCHLGQLLHGASFCIKRCNDHRHMVYQVPCNTRNEG